jgi:hypothetical protein
MFLALLNGLLNRLIPDKLATNALAAQGDPPPSSPVRMLTDNSS